jgi:hypothetical protein
LEAGILAVMEDYIIAVIQYALLMSGNESRDCYHSAFHRIYSPAMHESRAVIVEG